MYNPYAPGGPLGPRPAVTRHLRAVPDPVEAPTPEPDSADSTARLEPVRLITDSARGLRFSAAREDRPFIVAKRTSQGWAVFPCGSRGGVTGDLLGEGLNLPDALAAAGYVEVDQ